MMFELDYDIKFGIHSDIPICCIEAYVSDNMPMMSGTGWNYRPCWECHRKNNKVEIHHCTRGCKTFLRSIGLTSDRFLKGLKTKREMIKWKTQRTKSQREMRRNKS